VVNVSRPGEAPNTDTGRLAQSIKFEFEDDGLKSLVGTNLKYGAALEFGTKNMAPRPWLSTAVLLTSKKVQDIFQKAFKKAVKIG
jgi:HK97 gp10 family phage protein